MFCYKKTKIKGINFYRVIEPLTNIQVALIAPARVIESKPARYFCYGENSTIIPRWFVSLVNHHHKSYATLAFSTLHKCKQWLESHWDKERFRFVDLPKHDDHILTTYYVFNCLNEGGK